MALRVQARLRGSSTFEMSSRTLCTVVVLIYGLACAVLGAPPPPRRPPPPRPPPPRPPVNLELDGLQSLVSGLVAQVAMLRPPTCIPPGGDKLQYDGNSWTCVCLTGWSGRNCTVPTVSQVTVSTQVDLVNALANSSISSILVATNLTFSGAMVINRTVNVSSASGSLVVLDAGSQSRHFNINASGSLVSFSRIKFIGGLASNANGGSIYVTSGNLSFAQCAFTGNTATGTFPISVGGALYISGSRRSKPQSARFDSCLFSSNHAGNSNGGAISVDDAESANGTTVSFSNCVFSSNDVNHGYYGGGQGGGLELGRNISATFLNTSFISNSVGICGGAINAAPSSFLSFANCSFSQNNNGGAGGDINLDNAYYYNDLPTRIISLGGNNGSPLVTCHYCSSFSNYYLT